MIQTLIDSTPGTLLYVSGFMLTATLVLLYFIENIWKQQ